MAISVLQVLQTVDKCYNNSDLKKTIVLGLLKGWSEAMEDSRIIVDDYSYNIEGDNGDMQLDIMVKLRKEV